MNQLPRRSSRLNPERTVSSNYLELTNVFLHEKHPKVLTITKSNVEFESLMIHNVLQNFNDNLEHLWTYLGRTVKEVSIIADPHTPNFIQYFTQIRVLRIGGLEHFLNHLNLDGNKHYPFFRTVEKLIINEGAVVDSDHLQPLDRLLHQMSSLKEIHFKNIFVCEIIETLKPYCAVIKSIKYNNRFDELLPELNLDEIDFIDYPIPELSTVHINQIVEKLPNLISYKISCPQFFDEIPMAQVEKLFAFRYTLQQTRFSKEIVNFIRLEDLQLDVIRHHCFFTHTCLKLSLKRISVSFYRSRICVTCFTTMLSSLNRVQQIKIALNSDFYLLSLLTEHQMQYKSIHVTVDPRNFDPESVFLPIQSVTNLTTLKIKLLDREHAQGLVKVAKNFTKLHCLVIEFGFSEVTNVWKFYKSLSKLLKSLKVVELSVHESDILSFSQLIETSKSDIQSIKVDNVTCTTPSASTVLKNVLNLFRQLNELSNFTSFNHTITRPMIDSYLMGQQEILKDQIKMTINYVKANSDDNECKVQ